MWGVKGLYRPLWYCIGLISMDHLVRVWTRPSIGSSWQRYNAPQQKTCTYMLDFPAFQCLWYNVRFRVNWRPEKSVVNPNELACRGPIWSTCCYRCLIRCTVRTVLSNPTCSDDLHSHALPDMKCLGEPNLSLLIRIHKPTPQHWKKVQSFSRILFSFLWIRSKHSPEPYNL